MVCILHSTSPLRPGTFQGLNRHMSWMRAIWMVQTQSGGPIIVLKLSHESESHEGILKHGGAPTSKVADSMDVCLYF